MVETTAGRTPGVKRAVPASKRRRTAERDRERERDRDQDRRQREQEVANSPASAVVGGPIGIEQSAMDNIMLRSVASTVSSMNVGITRNTLLELTDLAQDYMTGLCAELHRFTLLQRRRQPSVADLALLMKSRNLHTGVLEGEMERDILGKDVITACVKRAAHQLESTQGTASLDQDSAGFFSPKDSKFKQLVPPKHSQLEYIPKWMPQFPPDHTYLSTPQFVERVTDPRQLREEIVVEGRFAEDALRRLIGVVQMDDNMTVDDDDNDNNDLVKIKHDNDLEDGEAEDYEFEVDDNHEVKLEDVSIKQETVLSTLVATTDTPVVSIADNSFLPSPLSHAPDAGSPVTSGLLSNNPDSALAPSVNNGEIVHLSHEPASVPADVNNALAAPTVSSSTSSTSSSSILSTTLSSMGSQILTIRKPTSTKMTLAERNKYDPFGVKTTSKKFDILSYISKRKEVLIKRDLRLKERARLEREMGRYGIDNDLEFYSTSVRSVVDREYQAAFASIQRSKGRGKRAQNGGAGVDNDGADRDDGQFIIDTGVVNNDRNRYVL